MLRSWTSIESIKQFSSWGALHIFDINAMDQKLFSTLSGFKPASRKHRLADDDFVDRINRFLTPIIISIFSIVICAKQYVVGQPLQCWVPKEFSGAWEQYAENYCWVQNTYYVPPKERLPQDPMDRENRELSYYQWVPFVLALQAGCFLMIPVIWRLTNGASGENFYYFAEVRCKECSRF